MYKDDRSSLGTLKEFEVAVCFVLKEVKEVIFKFFLVMKRNRMIFSCPTDDTKRCLAENLEGCEAGICESE